jgi:Golgi nucleoside diphosphatase
MRKLVERNECKCSEKKQKIKICADEFNTKICTTCYEIISYEKPDKKEFTKINALQPTLDDFDGVLNSVRQ